MPTTGCRHVYSLGRQISVTAVADGPFDLLDPQADDIATMTRFRPFLQLQAELQQLTHTGSIDEIAARVVEASCSLISAHGAVFLINDSDKRVDLVVHHGFDAAMAAHLDAATSAAHVEVLLESLGATPATHEIQSAGAVCGHLIVASTGDDRLSTEAAFILSALAQSAGTCIDIATMVRQSRTAAGWQQASGEIARALLADADIDAYKEIVDRALAAADADAGVLMVPSEDGQLLILATGGRVDGSARGLLIAPESSEVTRVVTRATAFRTTQITDMIPALREVLGTSSALMIAPLLDAVGSRGSVLVSRSSGRGFTETDLAQFANYCEQVALAMQFADARLDADRLQRATALARASRDLSDLVMQRLFAVGIQLESLCRNLAGTQFDVKLKQHIAELDETIDEIRTTVFGRNALDETAAPRFPRIIGPGAVDTQRPATTARGRRRADWVDGTGTASYTGPERRSR